MDIHIDFEESDVSSLWIRNVVKRDVNSDSYHVWFLKNEKVYEKVFNTKSIKCVDVYSRN